MNPLAHLYHEFNTGSAADKLKHLPDFPLMIDVEVTNACNYSCLFCPTGVKAMRRPTGFMEWETWVRLVEQCADHGTALRIIGWGEGSLHPKLIEMIDLASDNGLLTHWNTNASKITPSYAERLVRAGLSSIKMSFQGIDRKTYAEARQIDFFDGMLDAIRMVRRARGDNPLPFIAASTSITNETMGQVEEFRKIIEPLVDQLTIGRTTFDYFDASAVRLRPTQKALFDRVRALQTVERKHPSPCPEVYSKLSVSWDGTVRVCCNDFDGLTDLGNLNEQSVAEIWRHKLIEDYRTRLARGEYESPLCSNCFDYMDLTEGTA